MSFCDGGLTAARRNLFFDERRLRLSKRDQHDKRRLQNPIKDSSAFPRWVPPVSYDRTLLDGREWKIPERSSTRSLSPDAADGRRRSARLTRTQRKSRGVRLSDPQRLDSIQSDVSAMVATKYTRIPLVLFKDDSDASRGLCVRTTVRITRLALVCEYAGEHIVASQAELRENMYDESLGSYMFFYWLGGFVYCVDSTVVPPDDATRLHYGYARYINHSRQSANLYGRIIRAARSPTDSTVVPHLCFFAKRNINAGEELLIDYGDRDRTRMEAFPWLRT